MEIIEELSQRLKKLGELGLKHELDIIFVYFDEYNMADAHYFTNIWTQFERGFATFTVSTGKVCFLVGPETAEFVKVYRPFLESRIISLLLAPGAAYPNTNAEEVSDVVKDLVGRKPKRIGLVGSGSIPFYLYESLNFLATEIVDISSDVQRARQIKSNGEINDIKKAYQIADEGLKALLNKLSPGLTETALAGIGEEAMRAAGAEGYGISTILTSGRHTNSIFGRPSSQQLNDSLIMIGISPRFNGYCASLGIPATIGKVSAESLAFVKNMLDIYHTIEAVLEAGKMASEIYVISREELARYKLEKFQIYGAINSLGLFESEPPFLSKDPDWELEPGMILSIDLAVFHPKLFGIRFKSGYLITQKGFSPLSGFFDTACKIVTKHSSQAT